MTEPAIIVSHIEYRVILAIPSSGNILMSLDGDGFRLPSVHIPKWTRPAEEITRVLREKWNLNACVLKIFPGRECQPACVIAEVIDAEATEPSTALCLCGTNELEVSALDTGEKMQVYGVLSGTHIPGGPFARFGWLADAKEWIQSNIDDFIVDSSADFRQYNASDSFALVRFATKRGSAYWLKATGEPNGHEFTVTNTLSKLFPDYLPRLVATREDWNAWVTSDAGEPLGACPDLSTLTRAVEALADIQIQSVHHVSRLKTAGCFDMRLTNVQAHLGEMIAYLEEAMEHQTSTKVLPLKRQRLREIGAVVEDACLHMQALGIPASLVNGDINLDNILYDGSRMTFIDWAEAGIGNPFLTLQQLIQHVIREGEHLEWASVLREAYKNKWDAVLTESQINQAFVLMPLLTMITYLYGRGDWLGSSRRDEPNFQGFARTVARHMDRAASDPSLLEALQ